MAQDQEHGFEKGGRLFLDASSQILEGVAAQELLAQLTATNPLFATLQGSSNGHLVVFDLTSAGRPSNHAGRYKFQLAADALAAAIPSIITKPIHVTANYDGHWEAGKEPKAIGTFLGCQEITNPDGTKTARAIGVLWDSDFPEDIEFIKANKDILGASYEIEYEAESASLIAANVVEIKSWRFTGGAILRKSDAAHPETQMLAANDVLPSGGGRPAAPITQGGAPMAKVAASAKTIEELPEEFRAIAKSAVAAALAEQAEKSETADLHAQIASLTKKVAESDEKFEDMEDKASKANSTMTEYAAKIAALEAEMTTVKAERDAMQAQAQALQAEKDEAVKAAALEASWKDIQAKYNHADNKREALLPLVAKLIGQAEGVLSIEEATKLFPATASGRDEAAAARAKQPLIASGETQVGAPVASDEEVAKRWPAAVAARKVR